MAAESAATLLIRSFSTSEAVVTASYWQQVQVERDHERRKRIKGLDAKSQQDIHYAQATEKWGLSGSQNGKEFASLINNFIIILYYANEAAHMQIQIYKSNI